MALRITVLKDGVEHEVKHTLTGFKLKEYNSTLSEDSALKSDFSVGLKIPVEGNELVFDMKHLDSVLDRSFAYDARFYSVDGKVYNGALYLEGIVEDAAYRYFDMNYVNSDYNTKIAGKTLRNLEETTISLPLAPSDMVLDFAAANLLSWPEGLYYVPMMHHGSLVQKGFNVWDQGAQAFLFNTGQPDLYHICPQVYLLEVLKRCFTSFGYTVDGPVFRDELMRNLLLGGLRSTTQMGVKYMAHYVSNNTQVVDNTASPSAQYPLVMDEALYDFNTLPSMLPSGTPYDPPIIDTYKYNLIVVFGAVVSPVLNIFSQSGAFITSINPVANTTMTVQFTTVNVPTNMGLRLSAQFGHICEIMPGTKFKIYPMQNETTPEEYGFWMRSFRLTDLLPNVSVAEFLLAVKRLNLNIDVNNNARSAWITYSDELLQDTAIEPIVSAARQLKTEGSRKVVLEYMDGGFDALGFPRYDVDRPEDISIVVGEPANYFVKQTNTIYQYNGGTDLVFEPQELAGVDNYRLEFGSGVEKVLSMGSKLMPMTVQTLGGEKSLAVFVAEELKHQKFNEPQTDSWNLFLMIKRGMQNGSGGAYPMAGVTRYDYNMFDFGNDLLLRADATSIVFVRWKKWLEALSRNEVLMIKMMAKPGVFVSAPNERVRINNLVYLTKSRTRELAGGEVIEMECLRM